METLIKKKHAEKQLVLGILVVVIGSVLLLRNAEIDIPRWILSWHTIMLGAGLWMGYRKNFQGGGWLALTIIGAIFTLKDMTVFDFELSRITTALVLIGLGLYVIFKPKKNIFFGKHFEKKSVEFTETEK